MFLISALSNFLQSRTKTASRSFHVLWSLTAVFSSNKNILCIGFDMVLGHQGYGRAKLEKKQQPQSLWLHEKIMKLFRLQSVYWAEAAEEPVSLFDIRGEKQQQPDAPPFSLGGKNLFIFPTLSFRGSLFVPIQLRQHLLGIMKISNLAKYFIPSSTSIIACKPFSSCNLLS